MIPLNVVFIYIESSQLRLCYDYSYFRQKLSISIKIIQIENSLKKNLSEKKPEIQTFSEGGVASS